MRGSKMEAHIRFLDIYQDSGRIVTLKKLLDEIDSNFKKIIEKELGRKVPDDALERFPTYAIRRILAIREMGERADLGNLVELVATKSDRLADPTEYSTRQKNRDLVEAAKQLSQYPNQAVPMLEDALKEDKINRKMVYYALGLCGTQEAVLILKSQALKEKNSNWTRPVVYALSLAGKEGEAALDNLEESAQGNLKIAIKQYQRGILGEADKEIVYPKLPEKVKLPERLSEIDEEVAYEESLPDSVEVVLSCPISTMKTLFTSVIIDDIESFNKCVTEGKEWYGIYEDLADINREKWLRYELSEPKYIEEDTAEVRVTMNIRRKSPELIFTLRKIEGIWRATGVKEVRRRDLVK
jgi:hypothetical protein